MRRRLTCGLMLVALATLAPMRAAAQHVHPPPAPATPPAPQPPPEPASDEHDHSAHHAPASDVLPAFIPPLTDADRAAAFPDVHGHLVHDNSVNYFVLADRLEWTTGQGASAGTWNAMGWVGRDRDRLWFRSEGERDADGFDHAEAQVFYGRAVARWWDLLAGVRHDVRPGPGRSWVGLGVQGLAPYWFEVQATAYLGEGGRTQLRLETEYDLLLTNRLILQPVVELDVYGRDDPSRGIAAGLSSGEAGIRLRYEVRREFAPYVGVTWDRRFFGTADLARAAGERTSGARLALGLRLWM